MSGHWKCCSGPNTYFSHHYVPNDASLYYKRSNKASVKEMKLSSCRTREYEWQWMYIPPPFNVLKYDTVGVRSASRIGRLTHPWKGSGAHWIGCSPDPTAARFFMKQTGNSYHSQESNHDSSDTQLCCRQSTACEITDPWRCLQFICTIYSASLFLHSYFTLCVISYYLI